jgi:hypothetical protein
MQEIYGMALATLHKESATCTHQLVCQKEDGLQAEFTVAVVEEIFDGWAKVVKNHGIEVTFYSEPADRGDANATGNTFVHLIFMLKLRSLCFDRLKLDGEFLF